MRLIGLNVHKRVVQACVLDADGVQLDAIRFDLTLDSLHGRIFRPSTALIAVAQASPHRPFSASWQSR